MKTVVKVLVVMCAIVVGELVVAESATADVLCVSGSVVKAYPGKKCLEGSKNQLHQNWHSVGFACER